MPNQRTYQTTAQDTAIVTIDWQFQGWDLWWCGVAKAYIFADGPDGVNQILVSNLQDCPCNGCQWNYSTSGKTTIQVHQGYAFGVKIHISNTRQSRGTFMAF